MSTRIDKNVTKFKATIKGTPLRRSAVHSRTQSRSSNTSVAQRTTPDSTSACRRSDSTSDTETSSRPPSEQPIGQSGPAPAPSTSDSHVWVHVQSPTKHHSDGAVNTVSPSSSAMPPPSITPSTRGTVSKSPSILSSSGPSRPSISIITPTSRPNPLDMSPATPKTPVLIGTPSRTRPPITASKPSHSPPMLSALRAAPSETVTTTAHTSNHSVEIITNTEPLSSSESGSSTFLNFDTPTTPSLVSSSPPLSHTTGTTLSIPIDPILLTASESEVSSTGVSPQISPSSIAISTNTPGFPRPRKRQRVQDSSQGFQDLASTTVNADKGESSRVTAENPRYSLRGRKPPTTATGSTVSNCHNTHVRGEGEEDLDLDSGSEFVPELGDEEQDTSIVTRSDTASRLDMQDDIIVDREPTVTGEAALNYTAPSPAKRKRSARKKKPISDTPDPPKRRSKPKPKGTPSIDATAPLPDHDPTTTLMSVLIENLPVGKQSSRYREVIQKHSEAKRREREERVKVKERIKRNEVLGKVGRLGMDEEAESQRQQQEGGPGVRAVTDAHEVDRTTAEERAVTNDEESVEEPMAPSDEFASLRDADMVPQMRIDPTTGELVLDELGLEVDRGGRGTTNPEETYEVVEEREQDRFFNSATYTKRVRSTRWTADETAAFYRYLSMFGTDFESIARVMHGRTRREIKAKFNTEDKKYPDLITASMKTRIPIDLIETGRITGKDLSGPPPEIRVPVRTAMGIAPDATGKSSRAGEKSKMADEEAEATEIGQEEIGMSIEQYEKDAGFQTP